MSIPLRQMRLVQIKETTITTIVIEIIIIIHLVFFFNIIGSIAVLRPSSSGIQHL